MYEQFKKYTAPYYVDLTPFRGDASIDLKWRLSQRLREVRLNGKRAVVLYFGDLDPSGWEMLPTMLETLQSEMGLGDTVDGQRCALTPEQVEKYNLPHNPDALKLTDSRARKYMDRFGDLAVELDALPPPELEKIVRESIEANLDLSRCEVERRREVGDRHRLEDLRGHVHELIEGAV